jgi:hypothetical protein
VVAVASWQCHTMAQVNHTQLQLCHWMSQLNEQRASYISRLYRTTATTELVCARHSVAGDHLFHAPHVYPVLSLFPMSLQRLVRSIFSTGQVPLLEGAANTDLPSSREFMIRCGAWTTAHACWL